MTCVFFFLELTFSVISQRLLLGKLNCVTTVYTVALQQAKSLFNYPTTPCFVTLAYKDEHEASPSLYRANVGLDSEKVNSHKTPITFNIFFYYSSASGRVRRVGIWM